MTEKVDIESYEFLKALADVKRAVIGLEIGESFACLLSALSYPAALLIEGASVNLDTAEEGVLEMVCETIRAAREQAREDIEKHRQEAGN